MELNRIHTGESPYPLEELEPSPIDETPSFFEKDYFPPQARSTTTLGISRDRIFYYLHQTQKYSSLTFLAFAASHITTTSLVPLITRSIPESTRALLLFRPYYQSLPMEPLLITIPLALHIASGVALRIHRRHVLVAKSAADTREDRRRVAWPKLSGTSALGYAAVPLVLGHAALTRVLPLWIEGGSSSIGLDYIGHGVAVAPVLGYLGFSALIGVAATHMVWGVAKWTGWSAQAVQAGSDKLKVKRRWWALNGLSALVVGLWAAGGLGVVARGGKVPGWVGKGYDDLLRHLPVLGRYV